jgi:hypothetical protein
MTLMRLIHMLFMFSVSYATKIHIFTSISVIAYLLLGISIFYYDNEYSFYLCVFSCALHGAVHAFGESVLLGFFKFFPSDAVFFFASGTGFS